MLRGQGSSVAQGSEGGNPMLYSVDTAKPLAKLREDLPKSCAARKFGVLSVIDLQEKMKEKGVEYSGECLIFEVCNPHQAKRVLEANLEVSTALPCRISVYEEAGVTKLATIRPTAMIALYGTPGLKEVAEDVEQTLVQIMDEAAR